MKPAEAAAFVRGHGTPEELASLATALVRSRYTDLGREIAREAAERARTVPNGTGGERALVSVAEALSGSGRAEEALAILKTIAEPEARAAALAHAAFGFAREGKKDRARDLVREVRLMLPSISGRDQQSSVFAAVAMAHIQLGNYAAALDHEGSGLNPGDLLRIYAAILQYDALRHHESRRNSLAPDSAEGLGRYGLQWP